MFLASYSGDLMKSLYSIPINGGSIQYEYSIFGDQFYSTAQYLYKYLSTTKDLYILKYEHHYASIRNYLSDGSYGLYIAAMYPFDFEVVESEKKTYLTNNGKIFQLDFIPTKETDNLDNGTVVYTSIPGFYSSGLAINNNNLFIQNANYNNNQILRGSRFCQSCSASSLELILTEVGTPTSPFFMQGFDVSENSVFYTNYTKSLYQMFYSINGGPVSKRVLVDLQNTDKTISAFVYYNDYIYYFSNNNLYRISTIDQNPISQILFDGSKVSGDCICSDGYSGPNCDQCKQPENTIRWYNGKPSCVPIQKSGFPVSCVGDYECGMPYGSCNGPQYPHKTCSCNSYFFGTGCQQCNGTISWSNGIPTCTPLP
ncbi:hypothetical protein DLAC_05764 [Tieghemostelium lacteum]|uniref:Uncharacterized protein n=1 Tax=Tieghemostelium lacteum TaxID=361077 RepID=A0A151ZGP1_TIELA|nr:hypothetical protein DLAC_05764 [Tieghemostelium lacteum]|eukprot:KYQ93133.1 hypothetical protein DLAC_05764 [Tieghemostelium lacteum]